MNIMKKKIYIYIYITIYNYWKIPGLMAEGGGTIYT